VPTSFTKAPSAILDYLFDWTSWLATGETLTASTMTATTGITLTPPPTNTTTTATTGITLTPPPTNTTTTATVWLTGGTLGTAYQVTNHVTTNAGRQDDRTITVTIRDR